MTGIYLIKKILNSDYEEDFINYFFNLHCCRKCGVECNNHYIEGPELINMIGCLVWHYDERKIIEILNRIKQKCDRNYYWDKKWIKNA
jgi:hypothetical protein